MDSDQPSLELQCRLCRCAGSDTSLPHEEFITKLCENVLSNGQEEGECLKNKQHNSMPKGTRVCAHTHTVGESGRVAVICKMQAGSDLYVGRQ